MNKQEILNDEYPDVDWLLADGFDDSIIGVYGEKVVYSIKKCIDVLIERDGMDYEDAYEFFEFNVIGAYVGEKTPIWIDDELFG